MSVLNVKGIKVTNGENKENLPIQVPPKGIWRVARDKLWELEGSTWYSQGTEGEHVMKSGNRRVALDTFKELERCTWSSQGTGGARDAGNSLVQNIENL